MNARSIPHTHGKFALVDEEDFERVSQFNRATRRRQCERRLELEAT
jgi:hypothetical protein